MADQTVTPNEGGREATILGLTWVTRTLLNDLQDILDERFHRVARPTGEVTAEQPQIPNVLDEIIENSDTNIKHLKDIISFIRSDVLPKIN